MLGPISPTGAVSTGPRFAILNTQVNAAVIGNGGSGGVITPPGGGGGGGGVGTFAVVAPDALPAETAGPELSALYAWDESAERRFGVECD